MLSNYRQHFFCALKLGFYEWCNIFLARLSNTTKEIPATIMIYTIRGKLTILLTTRNNVS